MKIYVFAVKLDEPNLYEVFERVAITEYQKMYDRWENGFSEGNVSLIRNIDIEKISVGSTWDGTTFVFNENEEPLEYYNKNNCAIVLSNNKVFGHLIFGPEQESIDLFLAATQHEVIGIDATDVPGVNFGTIWDGEKFIKQEG